MYRTLILLSNLLNVIYGTHYFQEVIPATEDLSEKRSYIYVNRSMTWNDAKTTCDDLGGYLAKTDRQSIIDVFKDLKEHEWSALTTDIWVGLIEPVGGIPLWLDCVEWMSRDWNNFANDTYNGYHQCYKLRAASDWKWESRPCWEKYPFICEKNQTATCTFRDRFLTSDTVLLDLNETQCSNMCLNSTDCWAVLWNDTSKTCYQMTISNTKSLSVFRTKICYAGETYAAAAPLSEDNSLIPNHSCILPTLSSLISLGSLSPSTYVHPSVSISMLESFRVLYINEIRVQVAGCDVVSLFETTCMCPTPTPTTVESSSVTLDPSAMFTMMTSISSLSPTPITIDVTSTVSYVETCICEDSIYVSSQYVTCSNFRNKISRTVPDVKGLVSNLTVNKRNTGAFQRLMTSAKDNRPAAVAVGTVGILFLVMALLPILTPDLISFVTFIKNLYSKHKAKTEKQKRIKNNERMINRRHNGPYSDFYPVYSSDVK